MSDEKKYPIDEFLSEIAEAAKRDERGFLAELRAGLNENSQERAWPIIARQGFNFTDGVRRRVWLTVGGLAAMLAPTGLMSSSWASMGAVMRKIKDGDSNNGESGIKSCEAKFRRLLNCSNSEELCELVVQVVRTAERKGVAVNCHQLFWDLVKWEDEESREKTRLRWTRDFYGVNQKTEEDSTAEGVV